MIHPQKQIILFSNNREEIRFTTPENSKNKKFLSLISNFYTMIHDCSFTQIFQTMSLV